jgi:hypothetical protein
MNSRLRSLLSIVVDRRLYGLGFLITSLPFAVILLAIQLYILFLFSPQLLPIHVFLYVLVIVLSGAPAKNTEREFHLMDRWLAYLVLFTGLLGAGFGFTLKTEATPFGYLQALLALIIPQIVIVLSLMNIVVRGQRISLRASVGLPDGAFDKAKKEWEQELGMLPNLDKIVGNLYEGRFVASLFDAGFFNLAILWSCSIMEEVVDTITNEIISKKPDQAVFFRHEDSSRRPYPEQLNSLGYGLQEAQRTLLWRVWAVRNRIAHHKHKPTFSETADTLRTLISFTEEMPTTLKNWRPKTIG